jgi:hypothetical protein
MSTNLKNPRRLSDRRISMRLDVDTMQKIDAWVERTNRAVGAEHGEPANISSCIRLALGLFFDGASVDAAMQEGHVQGIRHALSQARPMIGTALSGLSGIPSKKE